MGAREPGSLARRKKAATAFEIKASGGAVCRLGLIFPGKSPARTDDLQTQIQHRAHRDAEYTEKKSGPGDIRPSQICPFAQLRDEAIRGHSTTGAAIKAPKNPCTRSSADTKAPGPRNCSGRPGLQGRRYRDTRRAADRTNRTLKNDPSQLPSSLPSRLRAGRASLSRLRVKGCGTRRIIQGGYRRGNKGAQESVHPLIGRYKSPRAPQLQRAPWATRARRTDPKRAYIYYSARVKRPEERFLAH
jgi:hypothetical protein